MGLFSVDLSVRDGLKPIPADRSANGDEEFSRYFTAKLDEGKTPYDEVVWEFRDRYYRQ